MNGNLKQSNHLVVGILSEDVLCEIFVFQTIGKESFLWHPFIEQGLNLFYHSLFEACIETLCDALPSQSTRDADAYERISVELAASEVAFQHSLDIQSCSTTQYRALAACHDVIVCLTEILKIAVKVISLPRLSNINKVIGNLLAVNFVVSQVLACSDIHTAIHLTGVSGKYLATDSCCQLCGNACLAAGCRTCYDNKVIDTDNA